MSEPERLLDGAPSPLARRLLEAGLTEEPASDARARAWRACAGEGLTTASTFDGSARTFSETLARTLNLVRLPAWMRARTVIAGAAALAGAGMLFLWFHDGRPTPVPSHYAKEGPSLDAAKPAAIETTTARLSERALLDRAERELLRGDVAGATKLLERYRLEYPSGRLSSRADLLATQAKALRAGSSMDTR